jgi:hypothetical protein
VTESRQQNAPLYFGAVIALILHLLIAIPVLSGAWGVGGDSPLHSSLDGKSESEKRQRERLEEALKKARETSPENEDEVVPGLENGSDQGMTWIGYDEYKEQLAQHAEVEQAAFTDKDVAGGGALAQGELKQLPAVAPGQEAQASPPTPPPTAQPSPPTPPTPATPQTIATPQTPETPQAPTTQPTPPEMKPVEAVRAVSPTETPQPSDMKGVAPMPVETVTLPTAPVGPDPNLPPAIERAEVKPDPSKEAPPTAEVQPMNTPEPVPRPEVPPTEKPQVEIPTTPNLQPPSPQTPPSPPTPQTPQNPNSGANGATSPVVSPVTGPPGAPGKGTATGDKSDRESDATSIVDVPPSMWRSGKPLARKGLEIKTKKPELPILTRLTTNPGNPVCEVLFGKDGVPVSCKILQSSGFADIDGPVTDALYRWRAKGSQLEKLAPGKTVTFRIRFILN